MTRFPLLLAAPLLLSACAAAPPQWPAPTPEHARPLLIAHRGASGVRPEHTLEAYRTALAQGADCIEPDLVMTKDGVLVARHDTYLSTTTDVAMHPEFAGRKRASTDPEFPDRADWWVIDFTLAELKTLRAVQPRPNRGTQYDGQFEIPTFAEVLKLAKESRTAAGEPVCVYPEAKSPAYHAANGRPMLEPIMAGLHAAGMDAPGSPVFIQSFEPPFVKEAHDKTRGLKIVLLAGTKEDYDAALKMAGAPFWDGAGVTHGMVVGPDGTSTGLVEAAHARGIAVHVWTYRDDAPQEGYASAADAMKAALATGIDGLFTDFPASGAKAIAAAAK